MRHNVKYIRQNYKNIFHNIIYNVAPSGLEGDWKVIGNLTPPLRTADTEMVEMDQKWCGELKI